jgi:hypothetical protein
LNEIYRRGKIYIKVTIWKERMRRNEGREGKQRKERESKG